MARQSPDKRQPASKKKEAERQQVSLRDLEGVASRLSIPVRYERGEIRGGLCRIGNRWQIIINADLTDEEKTEILAESLIGADLDRVYIPPRVRRLLDQLRTQRP